MEHKKQTHLHLVANNETAAELASVAAAIHPLPQEVEPSQEFMGELRLRLLKLEPGSRAPHDDSRRAA
jgi:hypothetical protein